MVALLRRDGTLLLREPPAATGGQIPAGDAWRDVVAKGGGGTHALGLFDSTERVLAVRPLRDYPLVTVVGVDEYAALAAWRHDAGLIADAAVTAAGCILLLLGALLRQFRRVEASQAAMEAAHADLSRKSRELETTLAFMDQGLMMVDADGTVPVCNRRAIELLDLPPELMASRPTFEQVLAYQQSISEFRDNGPEVHAFVRAGGILDRPQTYERRRPCGRVIEVRSVPLAGRGVVRTYTDTTTRALGEERFRQIVNDSPLAIALISTADHRFVQVNPACCALVGRPAACLVGQPWQDIIHPDDHDELAVRRTPAEGRVTLEARLVAGNGTVVWTRLTRSLLPAAPGRAPLVLAIGEDITPQREMKARLRQAQRLEAVGQLTGGVAHDFNNLLGIIMLDAESLAEVSAGDPERARLANDILATAANGAELTRRLLAFARKQTLQSQAMDLNACVADSAALLRRTLGEAIQVRLDLAPDLWPLRADPSQVGDALLNLALNARDAMPAGGTLTIGTANTRVDAGDARQRHRHDAGRAGTGDGTVLHHQAARRRQRAGPEHDLWLRAPVRRCPDGGQHTGRRHHRAPAAAARRRGRAGGATRFAAHRKSSGRSRDGAGGGRQRRGPPGGGSPPAGAGLCGAGGRERPGGAGAAAVGGAGASAVHRPRHARRRHRHCAGGGGAPTVSRAEGAVHHRLRPCRRGCHRAGTGTAAAQTVSA